MNWNTEVKKVERQVGLVTVLGESESMTQAPLVKKETKSLADTKPVRPVELHTNPIENQNVIISN